MNPLVNWLTGWLIREPIYTVKFDRYSKLNLCDTSQNIDVLIDSASSFDRWMHFFVFIIRSVSRCFCMLCVDCFDRWFPTSHTSSLTICMCFDIQISMTFKHQRVSFAVDYIRPVCVPTDGACKGSISYLSALDDNNLAFSIWDLWWCLKVIGCFQHFLVCPNK